MSDAIISPVRVTGIVIHAMACPECGVLFGLADHFERLRRKDGDPFYCPNGHSLSYTAELSDTDRENIRLLAALDQAEAAGRPRGRRRAG